MGSGGWTKGTVGLRALGDCRPQRVRVWNRVGQWAGLGQETLCVDMVWGLERLQA